jgi:hypothetical protein
MFKVRQVHSASRFAFLRSRLSVPHAVIGKPVSQVAQCDLRPEFRGKPRQAVRALPRALAATDPDHNKGIEGEAVAIVHALMFAFCSMPVKGRLNRTSQPFQTSAARRKRITTKEEPLRNWLAIAALCAVSLTAGPARAWWDGGHMEIAAVAYDHLDPAVRAKVDALIKLNPDYSKWIGGVADADSDEAARL